jgi:LacI family gluconate utilization system Gnt-I transcriptional repressor
LVPAIASPVFQETLEALTQALAAKGYQLMLGESGYDDTDEVELFDNLISRGPDGIVLTRVVQSEQARQRLAASGIPVVETWDLTSNPVDMLIGFSHEKVGAAVADLLIGRGVRFPAMITGNDPRARRRRRGFAQRLVEKGCITNETELPVAEVPAPAPMGYGRRGLRELRARQIPMDGLFVSTDLMALGALIEAQKCNISVPKDLAIVGFGDLAIAPDTNPPLTTARIDGKRMGTTAAQLIIDRVSGKLVPEKIQDIGFEIVVRESA